VTRTLPDSLKRARIVVTPALREAVSRLAPIVRRPAEYHMGWVDVDGRPTEANSGKHVRAALALLSARAVGADESVAIPGAVAIELVHNFSLIHDDVVDNDRERRHRPTVWALFGIGSAIVVGDALSLLASQVLLESGPHSATATRVLLEATATMIEGEADDIAFEIDPDVTLERCLAAAQAKTGALLGCAASIGAILAGAPDEQVAALTEYGAHLGLAFQAVDDLLGIWGEPAVTGKPVWSDLRQSKKSIPVTAAFAQANGQADELRVLLAGSRTSERDARKAAELIERCGARAFTEQTARTHLDAALAALDRARPQSPAGDELVSLAEFIVARDL
jgi:geranylgeranyl diphosphate synthase type I